MFESVVFFELEGIFESTPSENVYEHELIEKHFEETFGIDEKTDSFFLFFYLRRILSLI